MPAVRYSFTLDAIQDADLIRWLEEQPTSAAVREALREYIARPSRAELGAKLDRLLALIEGECDDTTCNPRL